MANKFRNFRDCHNFSKKISVSWQSRKLEGNAKKILRSLHCTTTLTQTAKKSSFCYRTNGPKSRNTPDTPDFCSISIYAFSWSYQFSHIYFTCYDYIKHWLTHLLYILCIMNVVRGRKSGIWFCKICNEKLINS